MNLFKSWKSEKRKTKPEVKTTNSLYAAWLMLTDDNETEEKLVKTNIYSVKEFANKGYVITHHMWLYCSFFFLFFFFLSAPELVR